ncbi:MAG: aminomethyl-transferring glycine dehydrogenase subunit GcvPA [Halanaerobiaceae bacterium]
MNYISNTPDEKGKMLKIIGVNAVEELFSVIPDEVLYKENLNLPEGMSELELKRIIKNRAKKNTPLDKFNSFLGAGAYDHYIPAVIEHIVSRSEYYTAYTPYQAELSQGILQAIYEYQSMICELVGMEAANASLLDGGSAAGEAVLMAGRISRRQQVLVSRAVHPFYRQVIETYTGNTGLEYTEIDLKNTETDINLLAEELDDDTAAVVIQYPNFFGSIEDLKRIKELISKSRRTLFIVITNPITLGVLKPPGRFSADIVVGEGQPLGNKLNYGGPYLGFMAAREKYLRQMPGRIVGATSDTDGNRGYVLTLQTREQHIRRERATSNICTNEALNALIATIFMTLMGKEGIYKLAEQSLQKAHYLADKINKLNGYKVINNNFFHEFLLSTPPGAEETKRKLREKGILAGVDISRFDYSRDALLVCVTEKKTREELDSYTAALEVLENG